MKTIPRPIAVLILMELVSFGPYVARLGFYHDDWVFLELFSRQSGFMACVKAMWANGYGIRPMDTLLFPLFYLIGGLKPLAYHMLLMVLDGLGACLFFLFLKRLLADESLALAGAALALVYPVHPATHHWFANMPQTAAQDLLLASLLCHQEWISTRRRIFLAGGMTAYLLAMLSYESVAFLPLILGAGLWARRSFSASARALAPYGGALAAAVLWEKKIAFSLFHIVNPKTTALDWSFIVRVYATGLSCLTIRLGALMGRTFAAATALPAVLFGTAAGAALRSNPRSAPRTALWAAAAAAFATAYAPYALSGTYLPDIGGAMSRTNGAGALAGGLLVAAGASYLPRARTAVLAAILSACAWTNWHVAGRWSEAWSGEQEVFGKLSSKILPLPGPLTVILQGTRHVEDALDFVFQEDWGLTAALKLKTGRQDIAAALLTSGMRAERYGVVERDRDRVTRTFPYQNLYIYDFSRDSIFRPAPSG